MFAAASLQETFTYARASSSRRRTRARKVVFNFGPSTGLAEQIGQGAPADVFASASTKTMDQVVAGGDAAKPTDFATNKMQIAVPPDNPAGIKYGRRPGQDGCESGALSGRRCPAVRPR